MPSQGGPLLRNCVERLLKEPYCVQKQEWLSACLKYAIAGNDIVQKNGIEWQVVTYAVELRYSAV